MIISNIIFIVILKINWLNYYHYRFVDVNITINNFEIVKNFKIKRFSILINFWNFHSLTLKIYSLSYISPKYLLLIIYCGNPPLYLSLFLFKINLIIHNLLLDKEYFVYDNNPLFQLLILFFPKYDSPHPSSL